VGRGPSRRRAVWSSDGLPVPDEVGRATTVHADWRATTPARPFAACRSTLRRDLRRPVNVTRNVRDWDHQAWRSRLGAVLSPHPGPAHGPGRARTARRRGGAAPHSHRRHNECPRLCHTPLFEVREPAPKRRRPASADQVVHLAGEALVPERGVADSAPRAPPAREPVRSAMGTIIADSAGPERDRRPTRARLTPGPMMCLLT
jgi:hypothetical protein